MPERRGYPRSPPVGRVDYEVDGNDIAGLLGNGAHLVGKSYGGIGSLLAAALRPQRVLSLAVVEPPLLGLARGHPEADAIIARLTRVYDTMQSSSPEEFDAAFDTALGFAHEPVVLDLRSRGAVASMMTERLPFDARIPYDQLSAALFPKLVVSGGWNEAFTEVCDELAVRIHAQRAVIFGAGHAVGATGKPFNELLETLWGSAER
jgi:pimeloyl-ACP methyl ester carboxylesterase